METGVDGQTSRSTLGYVSLNRLAVCDCSDFHVCFVLEPYGVSDGPLACMSNALRLLHMVVEIGQHSEP